ncbi:MAG: TRAP transporter small permease [Desulfobacula sp.]|nr:TRAP transporter small permease [Desulfobacula sp.]
MVESENNNIQAGLWDRFLKILHRLIEPFVSIALFAMMALTFGDVLGRYLFNSPVVGGLELTEFSMAIVIFLGLVLLTSDEGHVTVDLLDSFIPDKIKTVQKVLINLVNLTVMGVISWQLWIKAKDVADYGDRTEFLMIPLSPLIYFMSIMTGISCLILFFIMINSLKMEK